MCDKGYAWNRSNYECKCDKSCDFGEYLDYEKCELVDECTENIDEVKTLDKNESKCSSCILYIVLFSIFFTINDVIATYFLYYRYMNHNKENVSVYDYVYQTKNY